MTLFSEFSRPVEIFVCIAALSIAGCQDTTTSEGGNGLVLSEAVNASLVETPPPGDPPLQRKPPLMPIPPKTAHGIATLPVPAAKSVELTPPENVRNQVRVAFLVPLSGPGRAVGQVLLDAATLAVFDIANGDFVLVPIDTKGTAEGALNAAEEAVAANVKLVIGPVFSDAVAPPRRPFLKPGSICWPFPTTAPCQNPVSICRGCHPRHRLNEWYGTLQPGDCSELPRWFRRGHLERVSPKHFGAPRPSAV